MFACSLLNTSKFSWILAYKSMLSSNLLFHMNVLWNIQIYLTTMKFIWNLSFSTLKHSNLSCYHDIYKYLSDVYTFRMKILEVKLFLNFLLMQCFPRICFHSPVIRTILGAHTYKDGYIRTDCYLLTGRVRWSVVLVGW